MSQLLNNIIAQAQRWVKGIVLSVVASLITAILILAITYSVNSIKTEEITKVAKEINDTHAKMLEENSKNDCNYVVTVLQQHQEADNVVHVQFTNTLSDLLSIFMSESNRNDNMMMEEIREVRKSQQELRILLIQESQSSIEFDTSVWFYVQAHCVIDSLTN